MEKVNSLGERVKIGGAEVGRKMSAGMSSVSFKLKEFFNQDSSHADKLVGEATSESLSHPDWSIILHICDLINADQLNTSEFVRAIKRRLVAKTPTSQYLALILLEAFVNNSDKAFLELATQKVLDDMLNLIHHPHTLLNNRNKALMMIQAWGDSNIHLRYLPVYAQTYKSLKARGIRFPARDNESLPPIFTPPPPSAAVTTPEADVSLANLMQHDIHVQSFTSKQIKEAFDVARNSIELLSTVLSSSTQHDVLKDDLTTTLVEQCRESQTMVHRIVESGWDNEALLFEALNVNDEIEKVVSKYEEMKKKEATAVAIEEDESGRISKEEAVIRKPNCLRIGVQGGSHDHDDMLDDLDEMIFGKMGKDEYDDASHGGQVPKKKSSEDYLISF